MKYFKIYTHLLTKKYSIKEAIYLSARYLSDKDGLDWLPDKVKLRFKIKLFHQGPVFVGKGAYVQVTDADINDLGPMTAVFLEIIKARNGLITKNSLIKHGFGKPKDYFKRLRKKGLVSKEFQLPYSLNQRLHVLFASPEVTELSELSEVTKVTEVAEAPSKEVTEVTKEKVNDSTENSKLIRRESRDADLLAENTELKDRLCISSREWHKHKAAIAEQEATIAEHKAVIAELEANLSIANKANLLTNTPAKVKPPILVATKIIGFKYDPAAIKEAEAKAREILKLPVKELRTQETRELFGKLCRTTLLVNDDGPGFDLLNDFMTTLGYANLGIPYEMFGLSYQQDKWEEKLALVTVQPVPSNFTKIG